MASGDAVGEILEYTTHKFSLSYMIVREKYKKKNPHHVNEADFAGLCTGQSGRLK